MAASRQRRCDLFSLIVVPANAGTHTALCHRLKQGVGRLRKIERPRRMGPGVRRGDGEISISLIAGATTDIDLPLPIRLPCRNTTNTPPREATPGKSRAN